MSSELPTAADEAIYPESDGKPIADNTLQWDWMVKIVGELRVQFAGQEVFVAGDLLWYPVQGDPRVAAAPDAFVVFGRPPGYRGSYQQWKEDGIAPQVVFEVLSPSNTDEEWEEKLLFYERHGVEEYYLIDPYLNTVEGYRRRRDRLMPVGRINGYTSPRLGIRFRITDDELILLTPEGRPYQTREEFVEEITAELAKTAAAFEEQRDRAIAERNRADVAEAALARERSAKELIAAKLREIGIDPDAVLPPAG